MDGYNFNFRFRYQLTADYIVFKSKDKKQSVSLRAADEIMVNAGKNIVYNMFDQNRIYGAVLYQPVRDFTFELGYMYLFQQRSSGSQYLHGDIIRLNILHRIQ